MKLKYVNTHTVIAGPPGKLFHRGTGLRCYIILEKWELGKLKGHLSTPGARNQPAQDFSNP
jgi:hypothetical protein